MSLRKRQPGVVLNRGDQLDGALDTASAAGATRERQARQGSLGLCVLAPLCLACMAVLWEGLYAHRDRSAVSAEGKDWPS